MIEKFLKPGKVILAGAGPGDPDLITIKAVEALYTADVVLVDRLVSEVILHRYVPASATIIYVGKECRKNVSTPQSSINEQMVDYALKGNTVVRLKGGDVSIFSNILDELEALIENKIPYEIIPGVTAALGSAAYAGIPLTARNHSTAVRFLTYYKSDIVTEAYWKELAQTNDTLVFYMSAATIQTVVQKLTHYQIAGDKQLAVVEQATTDYQNVHTANIYEYEEKLGTKEFVSPSLIIIGKVVNLHQKFKWLKNSNTQENYFTTLNEVNPHIYQNHKRIKHVV